MAGSRLELIGTVFSRMSGLLRTGAIRYEDRPIWYDVYRVFPPKLEPHFDREPVLPPGVPEEIPEIMYAEDIPRAAFHKRYGPNPGGIARNLTSETRYEDSSVRFIEKYNSVKTQNPSWSHAEIMESVSKDFTVGFSSRQSGQGPSAAEADAERYEIESIENYGDPGEPIQVPKRSAKRTIVTADTLLSMFKEAKMKSSQKKDDSTDS